jgi:DNA-binding MarR family transcriptional regulator
MAYESTEAVYQFLKDYIRKHNFPPTVREIGESCHLARSTVMRHLDRLEAMGRITRQPGKARSITLTEG